MAAKKPVDKTQLELKLDGEAILQEERKMWMKFGFYIPVTTNVTNGYNSSSSEKSYIYDSTGAKAEIDKNSVAQNLRKSIIEWWESDRNTVPDIKPPGHLSPEVLSDLEVRRG